MHSMGLHWDTAQAGMEEGRANATGMGANQDRYMSKGVSKSQEDEHIGT